MTHDFTGRNMCVYIYIYRENGGTLGMVPLIINPIYTLHSGYLLGISPFKGLLGGLKQLGYHSRVPQHFLYECMYVVVALTHLGKNHESNCIISDPSGNFENFETITSIFLQWFPTKKGTASDVTFESISIFLNQASFPSFSHEK